jgi:NAD(P)-dependent dehydrogenase (short-subunit alcohol dehydrogenase family)
VLVADVSEQGNQETARMIEELGGRVLAVRCDVTRAEEVKPAVDNAVETLGGLDFAFNAGSEQPITATADLTEEEWDRIIRINLSGVFLCMKYEIPLMLKRSSKGRCDCEYLLGRRRRLQRSSRLRRGETWRGRPYQVGGPRLRAFEDSRQCGMP